MTNELETDMIDMKKIESTEIDTKLWNIFLELKLTLSEGIQHSI